MTCVLEWPQHPNPEMRTVSAAAFAAISGARIGDGSHQCTWVLFSELAKSEDVRRE